MASFRNPQKLLLVLALAIITISANAEIPQVISYQARLTDSLGNPVPDGDYTGVFSIYDAGNDGNLLWTSGPLTGPIKDGLLEYYIGNEDSTLPNDLFVTDTSRWFSVTINGEEIQPRTRLVSVPYAYQALRADTAAVALTASGEDGGWTDDGTVVRLNTSTDRVGIGTTNPEFKLTLDNDGGILAKGSLGSGALLQDSGPGAKMIWYPHKAAFRAGVVDEGQWDDTTLGWSSAAFGFNSQATAISSFATGFNTIASGNSSTAMGWSSTASNTSAFAAGTDCLASQENATAMGLRARATGLKSLALGTDVMATGENAVVIGSGFSESDRLLNTRPHSFMVGFERTSPTMFVNNSGVGINTTTVGAALEVDGVVRVQGLLWPTAGEGMELAYDQATKRGFIQVYDRDLAAWGDLVLALGDGKVGIGTISPVSARLVVDAVTSDGIYSKTTGNAMNGVYGEATGTGGHGLYGVAGGSGGIGIYAEGGTGGYAADFRGNVIVRSKSTGLTVMELGEGLDYAEGFDVSNNVELESGTVLIIDPANHGQLTISSDPYDTKVAGIIAGANGIGSGVRLGGDQFDYNVALAGRVYCNVDATINGVEPGDLLTTSSTPGYAMKATDSNRTPGAVLGKAMQKLDKGEKGQILVLVTLQ